jgi:hypothetical protein
MLDTPLSPTSTPAEIFGAHVSGRGGKKNWNNFLIIFSSISKKLKQTGADLCQAQEKLGLAKPDLPVVVLDLL